MRYGVNTMAAKYKALFARVKNRGIPPVAFLDELVAWGRSAPDDIFDVNDEKGDVMGILCAILGPWQGEPRTPERLMHRKCCMLELLRCLAGFESSWKWNEGVDTTNKRSMRLIAGQETGIFQVSYDSLNLEKNSHHLYDLLRRRGVSGVNGFITQMKADHTLALEYCARLLRISYLWDGPIKRHEIDTSLSREAVEEFKRLLAHGSRSNGPSGFQMDG